MGVHRKKKVRELELKRYWNWLLKVGHRYGGLGRGEADQAEGKNMHKCEKTSCYQGRMSSERSEHSGVE